MPPIKVHIDDPITPKKGDAVTPQTANSANEQNAVNATTTTAPQQNSPSYPPARPGAAAVPAATPYVPSPQQQPTPTRTTASSNNYGPPPPQPGAVPTPLGQQAPMTTSPSIPPPPKAGEVPQAPPTTMPPQMGIPPPSNNYAPTKGTIYSPAESTGPTTLNFGAVPAPAPITAGSHPPGYQQNTNAQEMTSAARASLDATERKESNFGTNLGTNFSLGGGDSTNETAGNVWNAVKGWATTAGKSLAETEKEVWKRINGEK